MKEGYLQRKAAWEILLKVNSGIFSDYALEKVLINYQFNSLDKAFITELSFGCIRYRKFLNLWVDHTSKLNHQKQPPKLKWLLHVGLYQLLKMNKIPHSAAISSTVEVAKQTELKAFPGVINGILRNTTRLLEKKNIPEIPNNELERISFLDSLPLWLVKDMVNWFGIEKTKDIAKAFNKTPTLDLRVNSLKISIYQMIDEFNRNGISAEPINSLSTGIVLKSKSRSIQKLPGYEEGKWFIQDRSSQWVATLLSPKQGEKILDLCSAPGSKTTHLAELINDEGEIWAVDRSQKRLKKLHQNLERLNINCVKTINYDALKLLDIRPDFVNYFDKVLLDAPCSGIGTFSRNPDARWSLTDKKISELISLQEKLLNISKKYLKENGTLVYSTCTICPRENNLLIKKFLKKNPNMQLIKEKQILPSNYYQGDGFYSAIIIYKK